jgi:hypothetical protein
MIRIGLDVGADVLFLLNDDDAVAGRSSCLILKGCGQFGHRFGEGEGSIGVPRPSMQSGSVRPVSLKPSLRLLRLS